LVCSKPWSSFIHTAASVPRVVLQVDQGNIESRIWPRAAGAAARFWSSAAENNVTAAEGRLDHYRCHLLQRGIGAGPIRPASEYGYCPVPQLSRFNFMHFNAYKDL
jgi:hexosaminidase